LRHGGNVYARGGGLGVQSDREEVVYERISTEEFQESVPFAAELFIIIMVF